MAFWLDFHEHKLIPSISTKWSENFITAPPEKLSTVSWLISYVVHELALWIKAHKLHHQTKHFGFRINPLWCFVCMHLPLKTVDLRFSMRFMSVCNGSVFVVCFGRKNVSFFVCSKYSLGFLVVSLCGWHNLKFTILLMFIYILERASTRDWERRGGSAM